jgi:antirestriction protein ArdC
MTQDRTDLYTRITAEIIAAIEAGAGEFRMPWHHTGTSIARPANIASGKGYRGVNVLALWVAAKIARFENGVWGTYRQWQALEAQVRKGERGTTVVLWKQANPASDDDRAGDDDTPARRIFARAFTVFNAATEKREGCGAPSSGSTIGARGHGRSASSARKADQSRRPFDALVHFPNLPTSWGR